MLSRRQLLAAGTLAGGALFLPANYFRERAAAARPGSSTHPAGHPHSYQRGAGVDRRVDVAITPFSTPMPMLPVASPRLVTADADHYVIPVREGTVEILPGVRTPVYTYGEGLAGPTIRARTGRQTRVTFRNQLTEDTNVHLHGGCVPADSDGHPMDLIAPGASRRYDYPNTQQGATLWYHDHSHHGEAEHVYRGLAGFYLIDDPAERRLGLPNGRYDIPIMLREAQFDAQGALLSINPFEPSTLLANGAAQPYLPVSARKYRLRLLNAAMEYTFRLRLEGEPMTQIASDGGLLPAPVPRTELTLTPGERADVVVDFGAYPIGSKIVLSDATGPVLRFDVTRAAADDSVVPNVLRALPALPATTITRTVLMNSQLMEDSAIGLINGQPFDPERVDFQVRGGSTEIWNVINGDGDFGFLHNFHTHLVRFQVLDRSGTPATLDDAGLKDTIAVPAGTSVRIQATFPEMPGRYVIHCHFLVHSAIGMMAQIEVVR